MSKQLKILTAFCLIFALSFVITVAYATPKADEFSKSIALEAIDWGYARAASMCHIRSNYWWETLNQGFMDYFYTSGNRVKLSDEDARDAQKNVMELSTYATKKAQGDRLDCAPIVNGPIMHRLDQLQDTITGGYK